MLRWTSSLSFCEAWSTPERSQGAWRKHGSRGCRNIRPNIIHWDTGPSDGDHPHVSGETERPRVRAAEAEAPPAAVAVSSRTRRQMRVPLPHCACDCYRPVSDTTSLLYQPVVEAILSMGVRLSSRRTLCGCQPRHAWRLIWKQRSVFLFNGDVNALSRQIVTSAIDPKGRQRPYPARTSHGTDRYCLLITYSRLLIIVD